MIDLLAGERFDDLQLCGLKIIQNQSEFCFGTDTVLLADFASARPHNKICDLGTGNGILPLLISARAADTHFDAVELHTETAALAVRNVHLNNLEQRICVHNRDFREIRSFLLHAEYDLVVCNPPYKHNCTDDYSDISDSERLAKHECASNIGDVVNAAKWLLRNGGRLSVVFPAERMLELMEAMDSVQLTPKRFRLVSSYADKAPYICLVEGVLNARPSLHPLPPLILYNNDGSYTTELKRIYHML